MLSEITLQEGDLSQDLKESLVQYFQTLDIERDYAGYLFKRWTDDDNIIVYNVAVKSKPIGWIVYNPHKSLVEQILVNKDQVGKGMEVPMLDALIEKESLVAVEIRQGKNGLALSGPFSGHSLAGGHLCAQRL